MKMVDPDALAIEIEKLRRGVLMMPPCANRKEEALKAKALELLGNKIEERELELERRRVEEVVRQENELHPPTLGECPICMETVRPDFVGGVARFSCCGNYTCINCYKLDKITKCPLCRTYFPVTEQGNLDAVKRHAENGSGWAMFAMARMYEDGDYGLKINRRKAFEWYRRAAEHGEPNAMQKLGETLLSGEDGIVTKSAGEGVRLLRSAAEKGKAVAQMLLGLEYFDGDNVVKDLVEAVRLFTLSVSRDSELNEIGVATVFFFLGQCFRDGLGGLEKSFERAKFYLTKATAANPKDGFAQLKLAEVLYELSKERYGDDQITIPGHNCIPQVLNLLRRAIENGKSDAANLIDSIESQQRVYCAACRREDKEVLPLTLKSCSRCKAVWYCGKECQRKDWKDGHKIDCAKIGK